MSVHACILGATGYGGGELLRLLGGHPQVSVLEGVSRSRGGQPFAAVHPNLRGVVAGAFRDAPDWDALATAAYPVLFAALPHGEFAAQWPAHQREIERRGFADRVTVIDLSADFRLRGAAGFEYRLPEHGRFIAGPALIANPGCFATAIQLALWPLTRLPDPGLVAVTGVTGSSGSGAAPSEVGHHATRAQDFRAYQTGGPHRHLAEVEQMFTAAGVARRVRFVAHSAPLVRGLFVTAQFALPPGVDADALTGAYNDAYARTHFVRLVEGSPRIAAVAGSNFCDLAVNAYDGGVVVMAALDNLVKGMAGQAVQNMNITLGAAEGTGLGHAALWP